MIGRSESIVRKKINSSKKTVAVKVNFFLSYFKCCEDENIFVSIYFSMSKIKIMEFGGVDKNKF